MADDLDTVFLANRQALHGFLLRLVRDAHVAGDLTQECYLRGRRACDAGPVDNMAGLLFRTARNLALDHMRRCKVRQTVEGREDSGMQMTPSFSAETILLDRERLRRFTQALNGLPERARTVMLLSRVEEWPNARIAVAIGVSERTVLNDLKLAMAHCRDALARLDRA